MGVVVEAGVTVAVDAGTVYVNVLFGPWMPERVHLAYTYVVPVGNPILSRRIFPFRGVRGIHAPSFTLYTQEVGAVSG